MFEKLDYTPNCFSCEKIVYQLLLDYIPTEIVTSQRKGAVRTFRLEPSELTFLTDAFDGACARRWQASPSWRWKMKRGKSRCPFPFRAIKFTDSMRPERRPECRSARRS